MTTKPKRVKRKEAEAVETEPDAWDRFQKVMNQVAPPKRPKNESKETNQREPPSGRSKRED